MSFKPYSYKKFGGSVSPATFETLEPKKKFFLEKNKDIIKFVNESFNYKWVPAAGGNFNCGIFTGIDELGRESIIKCTMVADEGKNAQKATELGIFIPRVYDVKNHSIGEKEFTLIFLQKIAFDLEKFWAYIPKEIFKNLLDKIRQQLDNGEFISKLEKLFVLLTIYESLSYQNGRYNFNKLLSDIDSITIKRETENPSEETVAFISTSIELFTNNIILINELLDILGDHLELLHMLLDIFMEHIRDIVTIIKHQLTYIYTLLAQKGYMFADDNIGNIGIDLQDGPGSDRYLDKRWGPYTFFGKYLHVYLLDQGSINKLFFADRRLIDFFSNPLKLSNGPDLEDLISISGISLQSNPEEIIKAIQEKIDALDVKYRDILCLRLLHEHIGLLRLIFAKLSYKSEKCLILNDDRIISHILSQI